MNTTKKSLATATVAATALAGFSFALAPTANATETATRNFTKSFSQSCQQVGILSNQKLGATVSGTLPTVIKHGTAFKLTNARIKVVVPATINSALAGSGISSAIVTFTQVNLNNVNITPAIKDTIPTTVVTAKIPVKAGATSTFVAPQAGKPGLTVALTAGKVGTGTLKAGAVKATFQGYSASGAKVGGPQPVSCSASNIVLTTAKFS